MLKLAIFIVTINNGSMASVGKKPKKIGKLKQNGVRLEPHEKRTILFLRSLGYDIELIPPRNSPGSKTPDMMMLGLPWEMKCPQGKSMKSIDNMFLKALKQSNNILIDLRETKGDEATAIKMLKKRYEKARPCKNLRIITKDNKELVFRR